ncbi:DUF1758 domain-containing protein [Trichonephila clavipes]|nr:DUF1758 domain-containing protein [Trichonephila clavipes]
MLNSCVMHHHTGPAPGIMVWGGIKYPSRTPLVRIAGILNIQRYISEVLEPVALPYLQGLATAIFQQDNARPHMALFVQRCSKRWRFQIELSNKSEKAFCAVIYIRSKDATQSVVSRLLTSKTRVSPVKTQSLPRLELCSALLLANLLQATLPISETFAWSDSKITLAWLKSESRRWQPFVANRVSQIQELTPNVHWNFIERALELENPGDCGTRGIAPTKLEKYNLWFNGPDWLRSSTFPIGEFADNPQLQEHMSAKAKGTPKLIMLNVVDATFKTEFFQKFSSWNKLKELLPIA